MKKTTLLIDNSITGGRGMAKQAYELVQACRERGIKYILCTDQGFLYKLRDMGLEPDIIVPTALNKDPKQVNKAFEKALKGVKFDALVKIGARMSGPQVAYKRGIPYLLVDAALPDTMQNNMNGFYPRKVFLNAKKYLITTQFPWKYPKRFPEMKNIKVTTYPFSEKTKNYLSELQQLSDKEVKDRISKFVPEVKDKRYDISLALILTGSYVNEVTDRVTYGGWLTTKQYDQVVGFVRRLITDIGEISKKKILLYIDRDLMPLVKDLKVKYQKNLCICTSESTKWSYKEEFLIQRFANVLISRAANYQPYMFYMKKGGIVTSPVPSDGYMDEDIAAVQSDKLGFTNFINYADEEYAKKLLDFSINKSQQRSQSLRIKENNKKMFNSNDCIEVIFKELKIID